MALSNKRLGKGLQELIFNYEVANSNDGIENSLNLKIDLIEPNKDQPRKTFDDKALAELTDSISQNGILQPIIVRKLNNDSYQIIAGERRYRAAIKAGLDSVPVIVKKVTDDEALEISIIENIQREELNLIEEIESYKLLIEIYGYTHEKLSKRLGKDRATVTNKLRILKLPEEIKKGLCDGHITLGHAKVLLSIEEDLKKLIAYRKIVDKGLNVRDLEKLVANLEELEVAACSVSNPKMPEYEFKEFKIQLEDIVKAPVSLKIRKNKGKIEIVFNSYRELENIISRLGISSKGEKS